MPLINHVPFDINVRPIDGYQKQPRNIAPTQASENPHPIHEDQERLIIERRNANDRRKKQLFVTQERRQGQRRRRMAEKETGKYNNIERAKKSKLENMYSNIGRNINIKV